MKTMTFLLFVAAVALPGCGKSAKKSSAAQAASPKPAASPAGQVGENGTAGSASPAPIGGSGATGPLLGTCDNRANSAGYVQSCAEYYQGTPQQEGEKAGCLAQQGIWSKEPCATANRIASCAVSASGVTMQIQRFYSTAQIPYNSASGVKPICDRMGSTNASVKTVFTTN